LKGKTAKQIANCFCINEKTVRNYVKLYNEGIFHLLYIPEHSGRPSMLDDTQKKELSEAIKKSPSECDFGVDTTWACKIIKEYVLLKYKVEYTVSGIRELIRNLPEKFRFNRPTYVLAKANPEKQKAFLKKMEEIKKLVNAETALLYVDASHIRDYLALQSAWFPMGQQKKIKTYGQHGKVVLYGSVDCSGELFIMEYDKIDAIVFKDFLLRLWEHYKAKGITKIIVVLDNAKVHHAILLNDILEKLKDNIQLEFLPPYSPDLNPIEKVWKWLKYTVINNKFHSNLAEIKDSVTNFINNVASDCSAVKQRCGI
jgi:transposase